MTTNALMELADRLDADSNSDTRIEERTDALLREAATQLRTAAAEGETLSESDKDVAVAQAVDLAEYVERQAKGTMVDAARKFLSLPYAQEIKARLTPTNSGAGRDGSLALEVAYTEARVWKVEAMAARKVCDEWNRSAIAEGYGKGNTRACELLDAMDAARKAHEEKEAADTAIAGAAGEKD